MQNTGAALHRAHALLGRSKTLLVLRALSFLLLANCAPSQRASSQGDGMDTDVNSACTVREVSRERLFVEGGRQLYVEPIVLEPNAEGDVLLAGTYNYLFQQSSEGNWVKVAEDSIFGAVLPRQGPARLVRSPIPLRLVEGVRSVGLPDGRWAVVFAEVEPWTGDFRPNEAARLWHGILDGTEWISLDTLPVPPGAVPRPQGASSLITYGDTLAWAMRMSTPGRGADVLVYKQHDSEWSYEIVPTRGCGVCRVGFFGQLGTGPRCRAARYDAPERRKFSALMGATARVAPAPQGGSQQPGGGSSPLDSTVSARRCTYLGSDPGRGHPDLATSPRGGWRSV